MNNLTKEEMLLYFEDVHLGRYVYDSMHYLNARTKIKIRCRTHGIFEQYAYYHAKGHGCSMCKFENQVEKEDLVFEQFRAAHGGFYDYSESVYSGMANKIKIKCPVHGVFEQKAQNHLDGSGCMDCYLEGQKKAKEEKRKKIYAMFKYIFQNRYTYKAEDFQREDVKIEVFCTQHGAFSITPRLHKLGSCCPDCRQDKSFKQLIKKNLEALEKGIVSIS